MSIKREVSNTSNDRSGYSETEPFSFFFFINRAIIIQKQSYYHAMIVELFSKPAKTRVF